MKKENRYFLVAFQHGKGVGNIAMETKTGAYLNYEILASMIRKSFKSMEGSMNIISIIELPAEDFAEWTRQNKIVVPAKPSLSLVN